MDSIVSVKVLRSYGDSSSNCQPQRRSIRLSGDDIRPPDWAHHSGASVGLDSSDNTVPVNRRLWPSALNNELSSTGSVMKRHPVSFTCISLWLACCEEFTTNLSLTEAENIFTIWRRSLKVIQKQLLTRVMGMFFITPDHREIMHRYCRLYLPCTISQSDADQWSTAGYISITEAILAGFKVCASQDNMFDPI